MSESSHIYFYPFICPCYSLMSCHHNILPKFAMTTTQESPRLGSLLVLNGNHSIQGRPHMMCCQGNHSKGPKFVFLHVSFPKKFPIPNTKSCTSVCQNMAFKWFPNTPFQPMFPRKPWWKRPKFMCSFHCCSQRSQWQTQHKKFKSGPTFSCSWVAVLFLGARFCIFF